MTKSLLEEMGGRYERQGRIISSHTLHYPLRKNSR